MWCLIVNCSIILQRENKINLPLPSKTLGHSSFKMQQKQALIIAYHLNMKFTFTQNEIEYTKINAHPNTSILSPNSTHDFQGKALLRVHKNCA